MNIVINEPKEITQIEKAYINDGALICMDAIAYSEGEANKRTEIICNMLWRHLDYLSTLDENSVHYKYARDVWMKEILKPSYFENAEHFYDELYKEFIIDKKLLPKCVVEAVSVLDDKDLLSVIYA